MKTKTLFGLKPGKYRALKAGETKLHSVECTTAGDDHAMLEFCGTPFYVHLTRISNVSVDGDIITFNS